MPNKVTTAEEFNRENIFLRKKLRDIHETSIRLANLLETRGDLNMSKKAEAIASIACRALEETNGQTPISERSL